MPAYARSASRTTDTLVPMAGVLQRACACGGHAGMSGQCAACAADEQLGVQRKLAVSPPGDHYEQEADRIAKAVVSGGGADGAVPITPLVQRQVGDEDEEVVQEKPAAQRTGGPRQAATERAADALAAGGRGLTTSERAYFEPRLARDLSSVRLHDGPAAHAAAAGIGARAYTLGSGIAFAPGVLDSASPAGRRLLAHELVHVAQQGYAASTIRRQPDDEPETEPEEEENEAEAQNQDKPETEPPQNEEQIEVEPQSESDAQPEEHSEAKAPDAPIPVEEVLVNGSVTVDKSRGRLGAYAAQGVVDLNSLPLFAGDVVRLEVVKGSDGSAIEGVDWALPLAGLAVTQQGDDGVIYLRATASPKSIGEGKTTVEATVTSDKIAGPITVRFHLRLPPSEPDVLDPEERRIAEGLADVERRKDELEAAGELTKAASDRLSDERRALKGERRSHRQGLLAEIEAVRKTNESRAERLERRCSFSQQQEIQAALEEAISVAEAALGTFTPNSVVNDPMANALTETFLFEPRSPENSDKTREILQKIHDTLQMARSRVLDSDVETFQCGATDCRDITGARHEGGRVTLCLRWLNGNLEFKCAKGSGSGRSYALLHEFIHVVGISVQEANADEMYTNKKGWANLTTEQAMTMADSYATFAWTLARGCK